MGDREVQGTNDDAQISKLSCANLGYFKDNHLKYFVKRPNRRAPLINRGYFSRVYALRQLINNFIILFKNEKQDENCQIVSIGAGFDSTWFNLKEDGMAPTKFIELDFPEVTRQKILSIKKSPELSNMIPPNADMTQNDKLTSTEFSIFPVDLRELESLQSHLEYAEFDYSVPTFILSECVLVYLCPEDSRSLVRFFGDRVKNCVFVVYEQIKPNDAFGQQMIKNLEARGCSLKGLSDTPTLELHKSRFTDNGWKRALAWDMDTIYQKFIPKNEHERITKIEIFDEFEEWHLIQEHYCIVIGINDGSGIFKNFGFKECS